ncbi:hypothetical protein E6H33_04905 [Candidatus Bathyarchaeota archaeon]|nr:MAG: hypothetical protein E6H33_04905 [Candidatus Bathyarchaeota archaeon]
MGWWINNNIPQDVKSDVYDSLLVPLTTTVTVLEWYSVDAITERLGIRAKNAIGIVNLSRLQNGVVVLNLRQPLIYGRRVDKNH